ncbi:MAG: FAD-binding protein, partial [Clostridia bacterium]|nr:FAD-binding protein [Clostridia bacterium]
FDACAYEEALRIEDAEVTLLSMGPPCVKDLLLRLTLLGASRAILLSDNAFAGADTLATAYMLSLAVKRIKPDLIFCGRQTLIGDTAQVGPMLSVFAETALITNVMSINGIDGHITCNTRSEGEVRTVLPALLTFERINSLRLPSISSSKGNVEIWSADDIGADTDKCGLKGSPTRVLDTFENESGRRKCEFITYDKLDSVIKDSLMKRRESVFSSPHSKDRLSNVLIIGESPRAFAESVCDNITVLPITDFETLAKQISDIKPDAVLFAGDSVSKRLSSQVAASLRLGLCADCTALETDGRTLYMIRPALSGSVIARIKSLKSPALASVRTEQDSADIIVAAGYGAKDCLEQVKRFAENIGAEVAASRKAVDNNLLPYNLQVGLTGKTVSPAVYIAVGISGAVHHIVGMNKSGTVIAINPDKSAPIFEYADYGIVSDFNELFL